MKNINKLILILLSAIYFLCFSNEKANSAILEFDRDRIKRLSKNITADVWIPETAKKFYISLKPFYLNDKEYQKSIIDVFKKYFGSSSSDVREGSYVFEINLANVKYQYLYNQFNVPVYIFSADCAVKIYSPAGKLLLSLNIYKRNEKTLDMNVKIRDEILFELMNKTFNDYFTALNENSNYLALLSDNNDGKKVIDDSMLLSNRFKPKKELFDKNIKEYRLLFSLVEDLRLGACYNLTGPGYNLPIYINFGFKIYPVELFSIEHKIDIYALTLGNLLENLYLYSYRQTFMFYHELTFNSNFNNFLYCTPNFSLFAGHSFQYEFYETKNSYITPVYGFDNKIRFKTDESNQPVIRNSVRAGASFFINIDNPYLEKNSSSFGVSVFYMATFIDFRSIVSHSLGFDFFVAFNFNTFIYRQKPYKAVDKMRFRLI